MLTFKKYYAIKLLSTPSSGRREAYGEAGGFRAFVFGVFQAGDQPAGRLRILSDRPMYGYELIQELKQRSGGKYQLSLLYPVLYRLEEQGYLEISSSEIVDGRARNYYAVTPAGRDYLRQTLAEYAEISVVFQQLMEDWDGHEA